MARKIWYEIFDRLSFMSLSGVFLYCRMARWKASVSSSPFGPVLSVIMRLTVFTPTSALQLL